MEQLKHLFARLLGSTVTAYLVTCVILVILLSPLLFTLFTSFKPLSEIFAWPPTIIPRNFTFAAYQEVLFSSPMPRYLLNSLIIALTTTLFVTGASLFTAYGLSLYEFRGSNTMLLIFLGTRIVPPVSLIASFYLIFSHLGLIDTYFGLIILNSFLCYPLGVWMMKSFFDSFPRDLLDAARIDGCSRTGSLFRIVIPVTGLGIAAVAIISFLWTWNEFLFALIFTNTQTVRPVTVGAHYFVGDELVEWNAISATAIFTVLPGMLFFILAQRAIVAGLTQGAIKG